MKNSDVSELFAYDRWATERILEVTASLTEEQYSKNLGSSHGGIRGTLVHIYAADMIWLERLGGRSPVALAKEEEIPRLSVLRDRWNLWRTGMETFLSSLSESALTGPFSYKDTKGNAYTAPLYQVLQHMVNHSTYHRGQVITMLRQLGVRPVNTDLINYYRSHPTL